MQEIEPKSLKVFSQKVGDIIEVFHSEEGLTISTDKMWSDSGWNNYSDSWLDNGWNNYSDSWMNNGWNNYSDSWMNNGWNNYSDSWMNNGWNNYGGGGGCYITTATVEHLGMSDNCAELNLLRMFRDKFVEEDPEFKKVVLEYYKTAPMIVEEISKQDNKDEILDSINNDMVLPVISLLKNGQYEEAKSLYISEYLKLKEKYILKPQKLAVTLKQ